LPESPSGGVWRKLLDTSLAEGPFPGSEQAPGEYDLPERSLAVFAADPA
jgi:hypothetical protein